jgi:hypothetical protein
MNRIKISKVLLLTLLTATILLAVPHSYGGVPQLIT